MREVKLQSGAVLKVHAAPFSDAKALFQAISKEMRGVTFSMKQELGALFKDILLSAVSSHEIERLLWVCMQRCTYNNGKGDLKITDNTFESHEARVDFYTVCFEVAQENVLPFGKSLYAEYQRLSAMIAKDQK